jgi:acyl-CoA synthetase (AMP-forming)/AMP-acid ligase II
MTREPGVSVRPNDVVWNCWKGHAESNPDREAIIHWNARTSPHRWTWGKLFEGAYSYASRLKESGVVKGDICAIMFRHHQEFYPLYLAVITLGAIPSVLAYPNPRLHPDKFRQGLQGMARHSGLEWIITEQELEGILHPLLADRETTIRGFLFPLTGGNNPPADGIFRTIHAPTTPDSPCFLQHSSGTTGLQKAVVISNRAILENVFRFSESILLSNEDKVVSWLPLYHDMGLVAAFYLSLVRGVPIVQIDPFEWVTVPSIFMEAISREKGTLALLPNFAYNFMADRIREEDLKSIRLDSIRILISGGEPVRADSLDRFYRRFSGYGLRREALAASYGLAEATATVTMTSPGVEARKIAAKREELARGFVVPTEPGDDARICVSSGVPISGCQLRIVDESGEDLPEGRVGEVVIRSVSLFDGYRNDPVKTAEVLRDGWFFSGDYGFSLDGEYYIIGRKKDLIIVAGRKLYPEDIENAVGLLEGIIPGRVIAFGIGDDEAGTEKVCLVAETDAETEDEKRNVRMKIREACTGMDVTISRIYLAPPRWLIKSSSGKPSRKENSDRAVASLEGR